MIVREIAGWDYARAQQLLDWPLREVLLAYLHLVRDRALADHRFNTIMWRIGSAFGGKSNPPRPPPILKDGAPEKNDDGEP